MEYGASLCASEQEDRQGRVLLRPDKQPWNIARPSVSRFPEAGNRT
ncbi:hypothetical protein QIS74_11825 [Colletotrichum tabaci]|uniref:Uncharacterized protein n=1 Tax=Colletotrichum tabaci TaxID=1209068 RepID=A0AAV9SZN6_9PEZI